MCSGDQEIISPFSLSISKCDLGGLMGMHHLQFAPCAMYSNNVFSFLMMNMNIGVHINVPYSAPFC